MERHSNKWWDENQVATKELILLIIDQKLDLSEYEEKLPAIIKERFSVSCNDESGELMDIELLVYDIIEWENGNQKESLEKMIYCNYELTPI